MHIVADIGGTKMRIAASRGLEHFDEPLIIKTPQDYHEGVQALADAAKRLADGQKIEAVAADAPGSLSADRRRLVGGARHVPRWRDQPLADDIERAVGAPVHLENDTAQVGLGEAVYGAGKGAGVVVYITVSTGVNGARVVHGRIDEGEPEIGGQYLIVDGTQRTMEDLISGSAISEKYGVHPREIEKDSPVWEELARICAVGVHNTILHWSPERVVLGGSMFNEIGIPVPSVAAHVASLMRKYPKAPDIVHSSLGDIGGLWGGLALLTQLKSA